eukprot:GEMP01006203.1.p1 GENE.GEMP01006203.1~~GEMP01006203.1.p1  ORF type:complete len:870 (+),score=182.13 GEMP01006203.1:35-2644(+)
MSVDRVLLPDDVIPIHYTLKFTPDFNTFTYEGQADIDVDIQVATNTIILHTRELTIRSVSYVGKATGSETIACEALTVHFPNKTCSFTFEKVLPTGLGTLFISFQGIHNDDMAGFYRSSYLTEGGNKKFLVTTQFESIDARRGFPCWDEPARKATFDVTLVVDEKYMALCNMPEKSNQVIGNGKKSVTFLTTPKMSTYLLAFIVGEFDLLQDVTKEGTIVRCLAVPGKSSQLKFALKCGVKCLEYYNEFFGLPYPLPKMDMIAIPDFAAGAMENWGLVTYREIDLLCDEATASSNHKMRLCSVVTHELAHQWFGNLVTMEWWNDLWLNEGFASFMQELGADHIFPEWKVWEAFVSGTQAAALRLDAMRSSHPIQVPIKRAEDVEQIFDAISYCKGSSVVCLIYRALGPEAFQKGLQNYMQKYKYSNTQTYDLWQAWEDVSDVKVKTMMAAWTEQMGFPLLTVSKEGDKLKISQQWYLGDGSKQDGDGDKKWVIPVVVGNDKANELHFFDQREGTIPCPAGNWVKVNFGQYVPMRVLYSDDLLTAIVNNIPQLPTEDRIGLLQDCFSLFKSNHMPGSKVLELLRGFKQEESANVWDSIATILGAFDKIFLGLPAIYVHFKKFAGQLISTQSERLGWDHRPTDSDLEKQLRGNLISLQSKFCQEYPATIKEAQERYAAFVEDNNTPRLPSDYRRAAFILVLNQPATMHKAFEELTAIAMKESTDQPTRLAIYGALGTAPSQKLQEQLLNWALTDEVRKQDFFYNFAGVVSSSKEGNDLGFKFFKNRWGDLKVKASAPSIMQTCVRFFCAGTDYQRADDVEQFFSDKKVEDIKRAIDQTNEGTRSLAKVINDIVKTSPLSTDAFWTSLTKGA